jgi:hypothetical protein
MNNEYILFAIIGVITLIICFAAWRAKKEKKVKTSDIVVPTATPRQFFVFSFGVYGTQVADMAGWVNMLWQCFWYDSTQNLEKCIADIKAANMTTALDVGRWVFTDRVDANNKVQTRFLGDEPRLRGIFDRLRAEGVLGLVKYMTFCDEPNLDENRDIVDLVPQAAAQLRKVALEYPELDGVKLTSTFSSIRPYVHLKEFDVVGFDHYKALSYTLTPGGEYDQFCNLLDLTKQKTWLIAGAYIGQDPIPFINFANARTEVEGVMMFIHTPPKEQEPDMIGVKDQPALLAKWRDAFRAVVNTPA